MGDARRIDRVAPVLAGAALVLWTAGTVPRSARAEEADEDEGGSPVTYALEADFVTQYLWHGLASTKGAAMQPWASVSAFGATAWVWTNLVLDREDYQGQITEVDVGASYEYGFDYVAIAGSLQAWTYPDIPDSPPTGQAEVTVSAPFGPFSAYTTQAVDIGSYAGAWYGELGLTFDYEVESGPSIAAAAYTGWASDKFNDTYIGVAQTAWNLVGARLSLSYYFWDWLYLRPHADVTYLLDADLRAAVDEPFLVVGGIALGTEGPP